MDILTLKGITKNYGDKVVVNNVNLSVSQGDILGFLGPNGAGKSTTVKIITNMVTDYKGSILYFKDTITKNFKKFKSEVGVVPQEIAIYDDLSAYDNVKFFCSLYGFHGKDLKERVERALTFVALWDSKDEKPGKFSGGMKRRLNIACSIAHSPKLLIMDEPTVGIDPQSRNHILQSIKELNKNGMTIIYVSHYMEEIEELCNRIAILDHGTLLEDCRKEELKKKFEKNGLDDLEAIFLSLTGTALRDKEE